MLEQLSGLLRVAIDENRRQVPLRDERDFCAGYVALERVRLEERLRVSWRLAEESLSCLVPPFCLQSLVENAIKHAVAPRVEGGSILIAADLEDGWLRLCVSDDGPGAQPRNGDDDRNGSGLGRLRRQLLAAYGGAASLTCGTPERGGFEATLRLPVRGGPSASAATSS